MVRVSAIDRNFIRGLLILFLGMFAGAWVATADEVVNVKQAKGHVASVARGRIALEYQRYKGASKEILIPVDDETLFNHLKGLGDIGEGDTVIVDYRETYDYDEEEDLQSNFKRVATKVSLVRRQPKDLLMRPKEWRFKHE